MDVNKYIDAQLTQLNKTNLDYRKSIEKIQEAAKSEYHNFGGIQVHFSDRSDTFSAEHGRKPKNPGKES